MKELKGYFAFVTFVFVMIWSTLFVIGYLLTKFPVLAR